MLTRWHGWNARHSLFDDNLTEAPIVSFMRGYVGAL